MVCLGPNIGGGGSPNQRPATVAAIAVLSEIDEEDQFDEDWESKKSFLGKREYSDSVNCLINIQQEVKKLIEKKGEKQNFYKLLTAWF